MSHTPEDRQSRKDQNSEPERSSSFGWQPGDVEQHEQGRGHADGVVDDATPAPAWGTRVLSGSSDSGSTYWTPPRPGELPPTIIRRQTPPPARELIDRYGKPAMLAATVAAIGTTGVSSAIQPASAEAADAGEQTETGAFRLVAGQESDANDDRENVPIEERTEPITYTVEEGDEVREIAKRFGLQTMSVVWNNDLPDPDFILPGQQLTIPPVDGVLVQVRDGDTLRDLATKYGTTTTAIINFEPNEINNPDIIQPGQTLMIPGGAPPRPEPAEEGPAPQQPEQPTNPAPVESEPEPGVPAPESTTHVEEESGQDVGEEVSEIEVQPGDTLANVANRFGVTIDELASTNHIEDIDTLYTGAVLKVPGDGMMVEPPAEQPDVDESPAPEAAPPAPPEPEPEPAATATPEPTPTPQPVPTEPPAPEPTPTPQPEPTPTPEPQPEPEDEPAQSGIPSSIPGMLDYYANQFGLDANLLKALAWHESGWSQDARNPSGATGVMQIMPATGRNIANNILGQQLNISGSAADNILAGAAYLSYMIETSGGVERGLASYYQGPIHVQRNGIDATARRYIDRLMEIRDYIAEHGEPPSWR